MTDIIQAIFTFILNFGIFLISLVLAPLDYVISLFAPTIDYSWITIFFDNEHLGAYVDWIWGLTFLDPAVILLLLGVFLYDMTGVSTVNFIKRGWHWFKTIKWW